MKLTSKKAIILQLLLYKINWYLLVASLQMFSLVAGVVLVVGQLLILKTQVKTKSNKYWYYFLGLGVLGYGADLIMINIGWMKLENSLFIFSLSLLWVQFLATIPMMSSLIARPMVALGVGALGGPFAYYAGQSMGMITLSMESFLVLAVIYALVLLLGSKIHNKLKLAN